MLYEGDFLSNYLTDYDSEQAVSSINSAFIWIEDDGYPIDAKQSDQVFREVVGSQIDEFVFQDGNSVNIVGDFPDGTIMRLEEYVLNRNGSLRSKKPIAEESELVFKDGGANLNIESVYIQEVDDMKLRKDLERKTDVLIGYKLVDEAKGREFGFALRRVVSISRSIVQPIPVFECHEMQSQC